MVIWNAVASFSMEHFYIRISHGVDYWEQTNASIFPA